MNSRIILIALFVIIGLCFYGCSDSYDLLTPPKKVNVTGKVIGDVFNHGAKFVKVKIEDKVTYTDAFGNFAINDVQVPYDVYIIDTTVNNGSVFKNLSITDCRLIHGVDWYNLSNIPQAVINILSPEISISYFTNGKNINAIGNYFIPIEVPDYNSITGKVCVLVCSYDSNNVSGFNKFGYINNVTISSGIVTNLIFTDSMLSYNPPEALVSGLINLPPNINKSYTFSWISVSPRLSTYYVASNWKIYTTENCNFSFYIPSNLPVEYFPILSISYNDSINHGSVWINNILPKSGATNLNVTLPTLPQISSPLAFSFVDTNTIFSFYGNSGSKIFHISVSDSLKSFNIYTTELNINLRNLWKFGFGKFNANSKIKISIEEFGSYNSVDDYVNPDFQDIGKYVASSSQKKEYYIKP